MSRPNLYELPIWESFERRVIEVFSEGLKALARKPSLPEQEDYLSRELLRCCREANHRLRKLGRGVDYILSQVTNQPLADDEYRAKRLEKRPDFACGFHDDSLPEELFEEADYFYTVECKRLGSPSSPSWILNRNYVEHGVGRFDNPDWGYSQGTPSGMMVGFIQSMTPDEILAEVNVHIAPFPVIAVDASGWRANTLTFLEPHTFDRRVKPSPFTLSHSWLDLRACNFFKVADPRRKGRKRKVAKGETTGSGPSNDPTKQRVDNE